MKRARLVTFAVTALLAFSAFVAPIVSAEAPKILLLENGVTKLEATFTGGAWELGSLAGKGLTGTGVTTTLKGCENSEGSERETNLCKTVTVTLTGAKTGMVSCRSEMTNGEEKDAVGTILMVVDLHLATEQSLAEVLQPLLLFKVLGALPSEEKEELTINCGGVKFKVRGTLGCLLLPGLKNIATTEEAEVACRINKERDPETGTCEELCAWLVEHPFEANVGAGFEDAWMALAAKGKFNKDVFIHD